MKKRSFIREDEKAVSPVIATILMVAITVVLAAVLYIMVIGLTPAPGTQQPSGSWANMDSNTTGVKAEFASFSTEVTPDQLKIQLENTDDNTMGTYVFSSNADRSYLVKDSGNDMGTLQFRNYGLDRYVSQSDEVWVWGLDTGDSYSIRILWTANGATISSDTFST